MRRAVPLALALALAGAASAQTVDASLTLSGHAYAYGKADVWRGRYRGLDVSLSAGVGARLDRPDRPVAVAGLWAQPFRGSRVKAGLFLVAEQGRAVDAGVALSIQVGR